MKRIKLTELFIFIVSAELVGAFSGLISGGNFSFYSELNRPPFSPPGWVFPVVWGILYALMGVSAYLVYISGASQQKKSRALIIYTAQLLVNFMWSIIFFRFELLTLSAVVIFLLLGLVTLMTAVFYKINRLAAYLNIPYLIWVIFACYLNVGVAVLN